MPHATLIDVLTKLNGGATDAEIVAAFRTLGNYFMIVELPQENLPFKPGVFTFSLEIGGSVNCGTATYQTAAYKGGPWAREHRGSSVPSVP